MGCSQIAGVRYPNLPSLDKGAFQIINFDIGQADAVLMIYKGKSILFDCGSPLHDPLRPSQVIPRRMDAFLGRRYVDYFIISHYHKDHVGTPATRRAKDSGIYALIERDGLRIGTIIDRGFWTAGKPGATQLHYQKAVKTWLREGIVKKRRVVRVGDKIELAEGIDIEVITAAANGVLDRLNTLYPRFMAYAPPSENDYSVGLKITLGNFEMFIGGDLTGRNVLRRHGRTAQSYTDIETRVAHVVGPVEVYRANHHGSHHSSNDCFAGTLAPQVSVMSTGKNRYGHPDPEVYARLKKLGDVYITGGADERTRKIVEADIVGDDVEILVAPKGDRFWVNGRAYKSTSDAEEMARPGSKVNCPEITSLRPGDYAQDAPVLPPSE